MNGFVFLFLSFFFALLQWNIMKREKGKENEKKETTKQNKNSDLVVRIWKVMNERMKKEACFHSVPSLHYLLSL